MTAEQWARVKEIFHAALGQEASRRAAFVAAAAAGDDVVRAEVERLLEADLHSAGFIEDPAAATLSGRVIGPYEVGHLLGSGGMGRVYAARHTELGRDVAVKVAAVDSEEGQARLRREAQHASRLSHPNICHIYDVGRTEGRVFIVMELVRGRSLADVIRDGPLPAAAARRYGLEIADALAHAHDRGVTHRDLKSTNVMITERGATVLDFGLARLLDTPQIDAFSRSHESLTGEGLIAGTLPYLAPELLRGERGDQRADIWSLGVLLYEMIAGRRPFAGTTGFELSAAILYQPAAPLPPTVPALMAAVVERCLAKDPSARYQQASEVHAALAQAPPEAGIRRRQFPAVRPTRAIAGLLLAVVVALGGSIAYWGASQLPPETLSNDRAYSLLAAGRFEQAVQEFEGITEREPLEANPWDSLGEGYLAIGRAEEALAAYSRALAIEPAWESAMIGRAFALAALGRYDDALEPPPPDFIIRAFLLSRVGRYAEAAQLLAANAAGSVETRASALVMSSWLSIERGQHARALDDLRAVEMLLAEEEDEPDHPLLVLADLLGGIAEIRAGNVANAQARAREQRLRADRDDRVQANWVAALDAEIALAERDYDRARAGFSLAAGRAWEPLGSPTLATFALNSPSRDGRARVEAARGDRAAAIAEYRRLTAVGGNSRPAAALAPRHVLALARLLDEAGDEAAARGEYARFLELWTDADPSLPELDEARRAVARLQVP